MNQIKTVVNNILNFVYPIGSIYMSTSDTNPGTLFGGAWTSWGSGRVPVGVDTSQTEFNTVEKIGGEKTHTLTTPEMPSHNHPGIIGYTNTTGYYARLYEGSQGTNLDGEGKTGGDKPHNNLQPYITCYMWKRTA